RRTELSVYRSFTTSPEEHSPDDPESPVRPRLREPGSLMRQGPLPGRYPAVAAMVLLALIPSLALSAALEPLSPIIGAQLHASAQTMSLGGGLSNAAYAVGTVLA